MLGRRNLPFFFGVAIVIILLVLVLYLIFHHSAPAPSTSRKLETYSNDPSAQVSMLIDGPVNAPSLHNQVQIIITDHSSTINVLKGYNGTIIRSKVYANTAASFHVFLRSLMYAEFNTGSNNPNLSEASGYCPLGDRYIFSFNADGSQKQRYWTTDCPGDPHTFDGNKALCMQLFENQIPDYGSFTGNLNI